MIRGYFWNILGFYDGSIWLAKVNVVEELKSKGGQRSRHTKQGSLCCK